MNLYLAGPMTGIPYFNFPLFHDIAARLRSAGHEVFNPAEEDIRRHGGIDISKDNPTGDVALSVATHKFSLRDALDEDLHFICKKSDGMVLLPGWERSSGVFCEWATARALSAVYPYVFMYVLRHRDQLVISTDAPVELPHAA